MRQKEGALAGEKGEENDRVSKKRTFYGKLSIYENEKRT